MKHALLLALTLASPLGAESDIRSLRVSDHIHERLGGQSLERVALFGFDFVVYDEGVERMRRSHLWDRRTNDYRVQMPRRDGSRCTVWFDLDAPERGEARCDGAAVAGDEASKLLEAAYGAFVNDTWWVLMPFKWRDPGVDLTWIGRERSGKTRWDVVLLEFEDDTGLTPGDRYWAYVDRRTGRMDKWEMLLQGRKGEPKPVLWTGWEEHGGVTLSTRKEIPGSSREIHIEAIEISRHRDPSRFDVSKMAATAPSAPPAPPRTPPGGEPPASARRSGVETPAAPKAAQGEAPPEAGSREAPQEPANSEPVQRESNPRVPPRGPAAGDRLLVLNKGGNEAVVVDTGTWTIESRHPTGQGPHEALYDAERRRAYITNYGHSTPGRTITVLDLASGEVADTWELGRFGRPHGLAMDPDGRLWVTTEEARAVVLLDPNTGEILREMETGQEVSHMVALAPSTGKAFIANIGSGTVTVLPMAGGEARHLEVGPGPEGIAVHPQGGALWVANRHADEIVVLDARSEVVLDRLPTGDFPIRVTFTPDGDLALASHVRGGDIWIWDARTRKRKAVLEAGTAPIGILVPPEGGKVIVADTREGIVRALDLETGEILGRLPREASRMAWRGSPDSHTGDDPRSESMSKLDNGISLTWLGHAAFHLETPEGKKFLIDPWVQNNPSCPDGWKNLDAGVDVMLCTHGHFDHIGDAVEIAREHEPDSVVGIFELASWLETKGVGNTAAMNKGGTQEVGGARVTMVHAVHSCGILDEGKIVYGGEACGYVVELSGGFRIYHAGDTAVFGDMELIGELYRPDLALLPVGDHFTMGPREAAKAVELLGVRHVVPMHYGTFDLLTGTPDKLREATAGIDDLEITVLEPGETLS